MVSRKTQPKHFGGDVARQHIGKDAAKQHNARDVTKHQNGRDVANHHYSMWADGKTLLKISLTLPLEIS